MLIAVINTSDITLPSESAVDFVRRQEAGNIGHVPKGPTECRTLSPKAQRNSLHDEERDSEDGDLCSSSVRSLRPKTQHKLEAGMGEPHYPCDDELLRSCTAQSGFRGVDFHEGRWRARLRDASGKRLVVARCDTAIEVLVPC